LWELYPINFTFWSKMLYLQIWHRIINDCSSELITCWVTWKELKKRSFNPICGIWLGRVGLHCIEYSFIGSMMALDEDWQLQEKFTPYSTAQSKLITSKLCGRFGLYCFHSNGCISTVQG
jgi:hypothetical protein